MKRDTLLNTIRNLEILPETPGKQRRILVVDDDPKAVDIVSAYLEKEGFHVLRVYGGQEGIDIANKENPDLIVLDLMMPVISEFDVVDALKAKPETRVIPIIILSAKVVTEEDIHILNGKVLKIAQKNNFTGESFISEVRRSLGKKALKGIDENESADC